MTKQELKVELYRQLTSLRIGEATETEIQIVYHLSQDEEVIKVLKGVG